MSLAEDILKEMLQEQRRLGFQVADMAAKLDHHLGNCTPRVAAVEKKVEEMDDIRRAVKMSYKLLIGVVALFGSIHGAFLWLHFH
jgi:hypothetical protein